MAENGGQEKTEQPTGKRRRDARKEGNIFESKDIATVVVLFGTFCMLRVILIGIYKAARDYMVQIIEGIGNGLSLSPRLLSDSIRLFLKCSLPLLGATLLLGIVAHGSQTRFNISFQSIRPKLSKLNPISGLKKMFALRNTVELIKNLIKITLLLVVLYKLLRGDIVPVARMIDMDLLNSAVYMLDMIFSLVGKVCLAFAIVAFFDYLYQRWEYEKNLKMTKQEVKEEYKQIEGNPEVKRKIRRIQRQMAMSRMIQKVPQADVVIRNPTHFAVALKYDPNQYGAPVVLAKGQDELALRIIETAKESKVCIVENRPLARALYSSCEQGREIPVEFYGAVAEILIYIYKANNRETIFGQNK